MSSSGHGGIVQDDWDRVWQDYDRRARSPVATARPRVQRQSLRRRSHGGLLALALVLSLAPRPAFHDATSHPSIAEAAASLLSLAPEEAEFPPLASAISRLAAESTAAACWVMRLAPQFRPCVEP